MIESKKIHCARLLSILRAIKLEDNAYSDNEKCWSLEYISSGWLSDCVSASHAVGHGFVPRLGHT